MTRPLVALPILHPSHILRGQWKEEPAQVRYLVHAAELAATGWSPIDVRQPPPHTNLYPTLEDLYEWSSHDLSDGVSCDIEAAGPHPTIIGLTRCSDLHTVVTRWRRQGGEPWHDHPNDTAAQAKWLYGLLADPTVPLIFHNGQNYDIPEHLMEIGFEVSGFTELGSDTILAIHACYPEMPKSLAYLAKLFCRYPAWKWLVKAEAEGEGK